MFAGALIDRFNKKKILLLSDALAACSTVVVFFLISNDLLRPYHLYLINAFNGLMNTIQQPASDVTMTLITPKRHYQRTSGMRSFSQSLNTILHPALATAVYAFAGVDGVLAVDLATFAIAFVTLLIFVKIPLIHKTESGKESVPQSIRASLQFLRKKKMLLLLILFMAGVNLAASAFDAALPALILPVENGGKTILAVTMSCAGIATLIGSFLVTIIPSRGNRIRTIYLTMLISLSIENFMLAFSREPAFWCLGQFVGWLPVPFMSANLDVILRSSIPTNMQGRIFSCRNTLQYFTIPVGFLLSGWLIDHVCEPIMAAQNASSALVVCFGSGKGSGAAMMFAIIGLVGTAICLIFGKLLKPYRFYS